MNEPTGSSPTADPAVSRPATAGGMLRQARQAQGLHIAALAAAIKVTPRKLELLESDQFDQLTDATFTRALAQSVCRTLKIDAAPVLALLPPLPGHRLEQVAQGLNTPFVERPGRLVPREWADLANPVLWVTGLVVAVTLAVYLVPAEWIAFPAQALKTPDRPANADAVVLRTPVVAEPIAGAASEVASGAVIPAMAASAPSAAASVVDAAPAADTLAPVAVGGVLQLRTTAASWIEVTDARGQTLLGRVLQAGENVGLDGSSPFKLKIGNAGGTAVLFRGQPFPLEAYTRDNVARLELK